MDNDLAPKDDVRVLMIRFVDDQTIFNYLKEGVIDTHRRLVSAKLYEIKYSKNKYLLQRRATSKVIFPLIK